MNINNGPYQPIRAIKQPAGQLPVWRGRFVGAVLDGDERLGAGDHIRPAHVWCSLGTESVRREQSLPGTGTTGAKHARLRPRDILWCSHGGGTTGTFTDSF